jgi:uncharacterized protein (TIGR02444 family)
MTRMHDFPLWRFSLDRYARPGVAPLCLRLQERHGADVNLLLLALWLASEGRAVRQSDGPGALVAAWHEQTVRPLRLLRQTVKGWHLDGVPASRVEAFRRYIKAAELEAEHLEQEVLQVWADRRGPPSGARREALALANLRAVLPLDEEDPDLAALADLAM